MTAELIRAAVVIGVERVSGMQTLQNVEDSVKRVAKWARDQRFDPVIIVSDADGHSVTISEISKIVREVVSKSLDQLLVYFTGHGLNIGSAEYWLLSDAPDDPVAAVNVDSSTMLARYCGVPHVVLISDACRTMPTSGSQQRISGGAIFPNGAVQSTEADVDIFFACGLGSPALEIATLIDPTKYASVYTSVLFDALEGSFAEAVEGAADEPAEYVRPRRLKTCLKRRVADELKTHNVATSIFQVPEARITSGPEAWISRIAVTADNRGAAARVVPDLDEGHSRALSITTLQERATQLPSEIATAAEHLEATFGTDRFETRCGVKVRGAEIARAFTRDSNAIRLSGGTHIRITDLNRRGDTVVLEFTSGSVTAIPVLQDYIAGLTFSNDELVDVSYEPSSNSHRWPEFVSGAVERRRLRSTIAAATQFGRFTLEAGNEAELARRMQMSKSIDPTLAIYAAYAYTRQQRRDRVQEMDAFLTADLGVTFFDVRMLSYVPVSKSRMFIEDVLPQFPVLAQGWSMLEAFNRVIPKPLRALQMNLGHHLQPSLWTLFDNGALPALVTDMRPHKEE